MTTLWHLKIRLTQWLDLLSKGRYSTTTTFSPQENITGTYIYMLSTTCICFPHNIKFCFFMCCLSLLLHIREDPVLIAGAEYLSVSVSICFSSCFLCPYRDQCVHSHSHTGLCKTSISHEGRLALGVVLQQISANTSSAPCSRISTKLLPCNSISEHRVVLGIFLKSGGLMFGTRP